MRAGWMLPLAALAILAGCGQELTAGGQTGDASAVVTDDASGASPSAAPLRSALLRSGSSTTTLALPEGRVEVDGSAVLVAEDGQERALARGSGKASVRIAASDLSTLASATVPAVRYTKARLTFTRVEANVTGGLAIGLTGTIRVDLQQPLVVERPIDLVVQGGGAQTLLIDLNAADWLATATPLGVVRSDQFAAKLRLSVR